MTAQAEALLTIAFLREQLAHEHAERCAALRKAALLEEELAGVKAELAYLRKAEGLIERAHG